VVECHKIANLKGLNFPAHMISCLTEIPLYPLIIYIDGRILWCTHSLLLLETCLMMIQKSLPKVSINITWSTGSFKAHIWYSIFLSLASSTFTNNVYTQLHSGVVVGSYGSWIYNYLCNHWCCEFESQSGRGVQHYVIKFVSDLRQVDSFFRVLQFPPPIKLTAII
jgi:hypothetical protein